MKTPETYEEIADYVKAPGRHVFYFHADWCGDCKFIEPKMPEIEAEHAESVFVSVDRDKFTDLALEWGIMGIPSFVVLEDGKEIGRLVNKLRKTKEEVTEFLNSLG